MSELATRLGSLLEAEREALLQGDLERIAQLMEEKEALVASLDDTLDMAQALVPLQPAIRRNNDLFDQALAGIRAVTSRLGSLQSLRKTLETYDSSGRRFTIIEPAENRLEKRA
jgi:flagellar biosynthesis/type III secretory pathway chaperone